MPTPSILIVGAGALGQVYGYYLHQGGAHISYLLKYHHKVPEQGFVLYDAADNPAKPKIFRGFTAYRGVEDLISKQQQPSKIFDQIWFTVASDSLWAGDWLDRLLACSTVISNDKNRSTVIIYLQPDLKDGERIQQAATAASSNYHCYSTLIQGVTQFLAYQSPLPDETDTTLLQQRGVTYWFFLGPNRPRLAPCLLLGSHHHNSSNGGGDSRAANEAIIAEIQTVLRQGGMSGVCFYKNGVHLHYARVAAMSIPVMAYLETTTTAWSLRVFRRRQHQRAARQAVRQALQVALAHSGKRFWRLWHVPLLSSFVWVVAHAEFFVSAVPIERFLQFHFTKVGEQTKQMLEHYCELGNELDLPIDALAKLSEDFVRGHNQRVSGWEN